MMYTLIFVPANLVNNINSSIVNNVKFSGYRVAEFFIPLYSTVNLNQNSQPVYYWACFLLNDDELMEINKIQSTYPSIIVIRYSVLDTSNVPLTELQNRQLTRRRRSNFYL